ncbi:hypothetical protein C0216_08800 [Streptomyces globosus]|uniref:Uncharacterized protein n=1 Tax=Streptomyces globosus TaxID=68209 RepID=A0A344TY27_9ACTN|nr:hypothetical protein [Streptomyces globosus]AXE23548.1 hypothetical protein C0216_08800 [Streptomyces globosus]
MRTKPGPLITRTTAGAGHLAVCLAHWASGHTVSEEELLRRIIKARADAHAEAVDEHQREARRAHKKATKLRRVAAEDGGLVPAAQSDLNRAEHEARRHEAALEALGDFQITAVDPGQVGHRRKKIAALRCTALTLPVAGVAAGSWLLDGAVLLVSTLGAVTVCWMRGNTPFELSVRPVPAELLADTAQLLLDAEEEMPALPADPGKWKEELRTYVEQMVAIAKHEGQNGVHAVELLHGLQKKGDFLGITSSTFPSKLRDAGIPTKVVSVGGDKQIGVQYTELEKTLGHMPRLPVHLVPDLTARPSAPSPEGSTAAQ